MADDVSLLSRPAAFKFLYHQSHLEEGESFKHKLLNSSLQTIILTCIPKVRISGSPHAKVTLLSRDYTWRKISVEKLIMPRKPQ